MSKRQKTTRKNKIHNPAASGNSKYAKKVKARNKLCEKLGIPKGTPYPIIWIILGD